MLKNITNCMLLIKKKLQQETRNNEDEECDKMWKRNTGNQFILKFHQKCHNILFHRL